MNENFHLMMTMMMTECLQYDNKFSLILFNVYALSNESILAKKTCLFSNSFAMNERVTNQQRQYC